MYQRQERFQNILDQAKGLPMPPPPVSMQSAPRYAAKLTGPQEVTYSAFDLATTLERMSHAQEKHGVKISLIPVESKLFAFVMSKSVGKNTASVEGRVSVTRTGRTKITVSGHYQRNRALIALAVAVILGLTLRTAFVTGSFAILAVVPVVLIVASVVSDYRTRALRDIMYALDKCIQR